MFNDTDVLVGVSVISLISLIFGDFTARLRAASLLLVIPWGRTERITQKKIRAVVSVRAWHANMRRSRYSRTRMSRFHTIYPDPLIHRCLPFTSKLPYNHTEKIFINELYLFKNKSKFLQWENQFSCRAFFCRNSVTLLPCNTRHTVAARPLPRNAIFFWQNVPWNIHFNTIH